MRMPTHPKCLVMESQDDVQFVINALERYRQDQIDSTIIEKIDLYLCWLRAKEKD